MHPPPWVKTKPNQTNPISIPPWYPSSPTSTSCRVVGRKEASSPPQSLFKSAPISCYGWQGGTPKPAPHCLRQLLQKGETLTNTTKQSQMVRSEGSAFTVAGLFSSTWPAPTREVFCRARDCGGNFSLHTNTSVQLLLKSKTQIIQYRAYFKFVFVLPSLPFYLRPAQGILCGNLPGNIKLHLQALTLSPGSAGGMRAPRTAQVLAASLGD